MVRTIRSSSLTCEAFCKASDFAASLVRVSLWCFFGVSGASGRVIPRNLFTGHRAVVYGKRRNAMQCADVLRVRIRSIRHGQENMRVDRVGPSQARNSGVSLSSALSLRDATLIAHCVARQHAHLEQFGAAFGFVKPISTRIYKRLGARTSENASCFWHRRHSHFQAVLQALQSLPRPLQACTRPPQWLASSKPGTGRASPALQRQNG